MPNSAIRAFPVSAIRKKWRAFVQCCAEHVKKSPYQITGQSPNNTSDEQ